MARAYSGAAIIKARMAVWNAYPHVCHLCDKPINTFNEYEPDHLIPRSKGGNPLDINNMRPAHGTRSREKCNQRRGTKGLTRYSNERPIDDTDWFVTP